MTETVELPETEKSIVVERADIELQELCKNTDLPPDDKINEIASAIETVKEADNSAVPKNEMALVVERAEIEYQELEDYSDVNDVTLNEINTAIETVKNKLANS